MEAATGNSLFASAGFSSRNSTRRVTSYFMPHHHLVSLTRQSSISHTNPTPPILSIKCHSLEQKNRMGATLFMEEEAEEARSLKDFFELAESLSKSDNGAAAPPRWFSPVGCSSSLHDNCPLLIYLPGIIGTGAGLALQQKSLGKVFDIRCMHIPAMDRTPFTGLVSMVEETVRSESKRCPNRPIYIVGESLGGCISLAIAARNPDIDLVLILANPATSLDESPIQSLAPLVEMIPDQLQFTQPLLLSLMSGDPFRVLRARLVKEVIPQEQTVNDIIQTIYSYISILGDILPKKTLVWKLQMLRSASAYTNPLLHSVKAQILLLFSGKDQLLPDTEKEASRLYRALPGCDIRKFGENGHFLFLEEDFNLMTIIKATRFYRRGKKIDHVTDYLQPTLSEFKQIRESTKLVSEMTSPVILSTLEDGRIAKGFGGVPSEGPTIYVGNHMLLGLEVYPLVVDLLLERNIHLRGVSHPAIFSKYTEGATFFGPPIFDAFRMMGIVPVSGSNLFKLLRNNSNVLVYPGGIRESLHRKGEQYKLFWPEEPELIRMAARFGAKIVPFGAVGEDDIGEVVLDYDSLINNPFFRDYIRDLNQQAVKLRTDSAGEIANQPLHIPGIMPKIPGRFYFLFGKPIETQGMKRELRDRTNSQQVYLEVKSQVEKCIAYLKNKREKDPYRNIFSRVIYQTINGPESQVPTFQL